MQDNNTHKTTPPTPPYFSRWSFTRQNKKDTKNDDNFLEGLDEILNVPEPVLGAPQGVPQLPDDSLPPNQLIYNLKIHDLGVQQKQQYYDQSLSLFTNFIDNSQLLFTKQPQNQVLNLSEQETISNQQIQQQQLDQSQLLFTNKPDNQIEIMSRQKTLSNQQLKQQHDLGILHEQQKSQSQLLIMNKCQNQNATLPRQETNPNQQQQQQHQQQHDLEQIQHKQQLNQSQLLYTNQLQNQNESSSDSETVSNQQLQQRQSQFHFSDVDIYNQNQDVKQFHSSSTSKQIQDIEFSNIDIAKNINQFDLSDSSLTTEQYEDYKASSYNFKCNVQNTTKSDFNYLLQQKLENNDEKLDGSFVDDREFIKKENINSEKGQLINKQQLESFGNDIRQNQSRNLTRTSFFRFWRKTSDREVNGSAQNQISQNQLSPNSNNIVDINQKKGSQKGSSVHSNLSWEFGLPISVQIPSIISWGSNRSNSGIDTSISWSQNEGDVVSGNVSQNEGDSTSVNRSLNERGVQQSQLVTKGSGQDHKQQQQQCSKWFRRDRVVLVGAGATGAVVGGIVAGPLGVAIGYKSGAALVLAGSAFSTFAYHVYHSKHNGTPILFIPSFLQHRNPPPPPPPLPASKLIKLKYKVKGDSVSLQLIVIHRNQRCLQHKTRQQKQEEKQVEQQRESEEDKSIKSVNKCMVQRWSVWRPTAMLQDGRKHSVLQQAYTPMEVELVGLK